MLDEKIIKKTKVNQRKSIVNQKLYFSFNTTIPKIFRKYLNINKKSFLFWKLNKNGEVILYSEDETKKTD